MRLGTTRRCLMSWRPGTVPALEQMTFLNTQSKRLNSTHFACCNMLGSLKKSGTIATRIERQYTICKPEAGRPIGFSIGSEFLNWSSGSFTNKSMGQGRNFCALTPQQEEEEKQRVAGLTDYQKEIEKRKLDAEITRMQMLRGINTGELYTWRGKLKNLALEYGVGFTLWWYTTWTVMAGMCYVGIEFGGVDALAIIAKTDTYTGFDLAKKIDPRFGTAAVAIAFNELLEPIRLVFVVTTTKPVVEFFRRRR